LRASSLFEKKTKKIKKIIDFYSEKILIFSIFSQKRAQNPGMVIVSILSQRSRKNHKNRKYHDIYRRYISANPDQD
jgi:endonuclease III